METFFSRLGSLVLGEPVEDESEEQQQARRRERAKRQLQAKSQRGVLLEDLESAVRGLHLYVEAKQGPGATCQAPDALMASTDDARELLLTDEQAVVNLLCMQLERCLAHGLRPLAGDSSGAGATVKFFGVVKWTCTRVAAVRQQQVLHAMQRASASASGSGSGSGSATDAHVCEVVTSSVEAELPRAVRGLLAATRAASGLTHVRSDEGQARAFVRQALNTHVLHASLSMVLSEANLDLLASYYSDVALCRQRDEVKMLLSLLSGLDALRFAFRLDDPRLDVEPATLPFSRPLPRPKGRRATKKAPALIDPEDMAAGRVRLCQEDADAALLAHKLVAHQQLRRAFDSARGGNPLSETLRRAAQSQRLEDAAVAVLRFLELGYPEYDVFGTELLDVVCNPFLSGMARFDTALGLPDVAEACLGLLYEHVDTPGLLQSHLQAEHVLELRDAVEELGGFHRRMAVDPHEVAAILLQYLWELPEPLLTHERVDRFLACGDRTERDGLALLHVLVDDLPWSAKPLLERLCHWAATALQPPHAQKNGLTLYAVANCLAPLLLRGRHSERFQDFEDASARRYPVGFQHRASVRSRLVPDDVESQWLVPGDARAVRHRTRDAQQAVQVVALLLREQATLLRDVRQELGRRRRRLRDKVRRLESLRVRMAQTLDVTQPAHVALLKRLWDALLPPEAATPDEDVTRPGADAVDDVDVDALLRSPRWARSGFHTATPLGGFRGGGLLALECLVFFVEQYPAKARDMMARNAVAGGKRYPFPVASINVLRMLLRLLMLDEPPDASTKLVLHAEDAAEAETGGATPAVVLQLRVAERASRTPFWRVLDDPQAVEKLHAMAFMLLDLHWVHSGATQMGFQPVLDATRRQMGWLLEQAPLSVEDMWTKWMEVRELDASKLAGASAKAHEATEQVARHVATHKQREAEGREADATPPAAG